MVRHQAPTRNPPGRDALGSVFGIGMNGARIHLCSLVVTRSPEQTRSHATLLRRPIVRPGCLQASSHASTAGRSPSRQRPSSTQGIAPEPRSIPQPN